jgi:hypothetical protein
MFATRYLLVCGSLVVCIYIVYKHHEDIFVLVDGKVRYLNFPTQDDISLRDLLTSVFGHSYKNYNNSYRTDIQKEVVEGIGRETTTKVEHVSLDCLDKSHL